MQITVLSATVGQATAKSGKPYNFVELAYKGSDGQVKGKKVMPFGEQKAVYDALAKASAGEFYDIGAVKNEGTGYWDWISVAKADGTSNGGGETSVASKGGTSGTTVTRSTYETAEERAKKQVYIVRQSSVSAALSFLGGKSKSTDEVIQIAKQFEAYVFDTGSVEDLVGDEDEVV